MIRHIALHSLLGTSSRSLCPFPSSSRGISICDLASVSSRCPPGSFRSVLVTLRPLSPNEVLHVQVLHFHVPCILGQTLSRRQCSCCLGVASQVDLGSLAEIVQDRIHVQSICASCSERVELALSAALRVHVCSCAFTPRMNPSVLVNTDDVDFIDFASPAQSASVQTSVFRGLSCTVRNCHSSLCLNAYRTHCSKS